MPERCRACVHPKREEINRAILREGDSDAAVGARFGLSRTSIARHRSNHLTFSKTQEVAANNVLTIVGYANDLHARAMGILARAEALLDAQGDSARGVQAAAASLREVRASIELLAKLVVDSGPEATPDNNADLDRSIAEALSAITLPALPAGPALPSDVADAVVVE